jgi:hypothetical protein
MTLIVEVMDNVAKVVSTRDEKFLVVSYLSENRKVYKGAKVFSFESETELIENEQVTKRYSSIEELGFSKVGDNMYVEKDEVDEDSESEIEDADTDSSDEEGDFIVPDDEEVLQKPPDHRKVDKEWKEWRPMSAGAQRFKDKVDQIEAYMNHQIDEKFVFKK